MNTIPYATTNHNNFLPLVTYYIGKLNTIYDTAKSGSGISIDIKDYFNEFKEYDTSKPESEQSDAINYQLFHLKEAVKYWTKTEGQKFMSLNLHISTNEVPAYIIDLEIQELNDSKVGNYIEKLNTIYDTAKSGSGISIDINIFDEFKEYDVSKSESEQTKDIKYQLFHLKEAVKQWGIKEGEDYGKFPSLRPHYYEGTPSMDVAPFISFDKGGSRKLVDDVYKQVKGALDKK